MVGLGGNQPALATARIHHFLHQVRLVCHAVIGQDGAIGHLQRGVGIEALADADTHHVGRIPAAEFFLVAGKALGFPFLGGQHATGFAIQIDAGRTAQTELADGGGNLVDAHVPGQLVEEGITGHLDGLGQIGRAVAVLVTVAELVAGAGQVKKAGAGRTSCMPMEWVSSAAIDMKGLKVEPGG
jgi:hypothetical protein